ncbi:MAG TPA: ABC transporter substrate-binding protein [Actinomycetota bacterium]
MSSRLVASVLLMAFVLVSCGQKPGVHEDDSFVVGAGGEGGGGTILPGEDGTGTGDDTGGIIDVPGAGGSDGGDGGGGGGGGGGGTVAGDRTGISADKIVIGLHAPTSGAAPIEAKAFQAGTKLYWQWLHNDLKQKVFGKTVEVIFENDAYTPSTAVQKCNEMSRKSFLLIGGAGTDQINACANFSDPRGIPYLSPGVQETGLSSRRTYFAVTMSYKAQMKPLVQLLKKENATENFGAIAGAPTVTVGHIRPNTPNFDDADDALRAAVEAQGWSYKVYTVIKEGNSTEAQQVANRMQQDGVDIAIPITAPVFTITLAINTGGNGYFPRYAGVGITNNVNQMINQGCQRNAFDKALFFSPWPGWKNVMLGEGDADFKKAAQKYASSVNTRDGGGDLLLALWGIMKAVHQMFLAAGEDMTRASFVEEMKSFSYKSNFFPSLSYSGKAPFGASDVNVLIGSCGDPGAPSQGVQAGHQWITYSKYKGLRSSF